jgi:5-oxoprolinase (ATP-hydrolysing) subunit C
MIEIVSLAGFATIQDGGRPGHMGDGVPPGGAVAMRLLARANAAVRNEVDEAAVEVTGTITLLARDPVTLATDDGVARVLSRGDRFTAVSGPRARIRYVAVRGGIDVPEVLGGRGTLVVAGLGGHEGRPLRRGDLVHVRAGPARDAPMPPTLDLDGPVRVMIGPDTDRFDRDTVETFLASNFVIDALSDRVGTRLVGPRLVAKPDPSAPSAPMVSGAIQTPPSGLPIVLGPDHPTTGGYPIIATVLREDLGSLGARPVGASVRFVL